MKTREETKFRFSMEVFVGRLEFRVHSIAPRWKPWRGIPTNSRQPGWIAWYAGWLWFEWAWRNRYEGRPVTAQTATTPDAQA